MPVIRNLEVLWPFEVELNLAPRNSESHFPDCIFLLSSPSQSMNNIMKLKTLSKRITCILSSWITNCTFHATANPLVQHGLRISLTHYRCVVIAGLANLSIGCSCIPQDINDQPSAQTHYEFREIKLRRQGDEPHITTYTDHYPPKKLPMADYTPPPDDGAPTPFQGTSTYQNHFPPKSLPPPSPPNIPTMEGVPVLDPFPNDSTYMRDYQVRYFHSWSLWS